MPKVSPIETTAEDATRLMKLLSDESVELWVAGGWGIDALVGRQTRPHRDLDVLVPVPRILTVHRLLLANGFTLETDWFPTRFEMIHQRGQALDIHPLRLDHDGGGRLELESEEWWNFDAEALSGRGTIGGCEVRCLSVREQIRCHTGYEPTETDRADMDLLATHFGVEIPPPCR
jgi:lincosamide nucleotidyltransferase A/C/D/E